MTERTTRKEKKKKKNRESLASQTIIKMKKSPSHQAIRFLMSCEEWKIGAEQASLHAIAPFLGGCFSARPDGINLFISSVCKQEFTVGYWELKVKYDEQKQECKKLLQSRPSHGKTYDAKRGFGFRKTKRTHLCSGSYCDVYTILLSKWSEGDQQEHRGDQIFHLFPCSLYL